MHEGHGRSAVSPEPAHQNTQEVRGGCKRGRLLPVSISSAKCHRTNFPVLVANEGLFNSHSVLNIYLYNTGGVNVMHLVA